MKVYQIVRFRRTYGYITVLQDDHALIKDLHGKMHCIKYSNIQLIPGLDEPVAIKDLHKDDFVIVAKIFNDNGYGIKCQLDCLKVRSLNERGRDIGRMTFPNDRVPTLRSTYPDGDSLIVGIFKLNWKY